ncbi:MAG: glycosyltransferase, partial [Cyanobacteria bacterium 13_1_40CM_2_61_4]
MEKKRLLSVVVPCYNEESVIAATHERLNSVLCELDQLESEILYVDDGSSDRTLDLLRLLPAGPVVVRIISLSRNFGHQMAVTAGLEHAAGDAVLIIDADLQDPPEVMVEMVDRWRDGYHVVYGARIDREGETAFKRLTAKLFYRVINRLSETKIPLDVGDFRLMDRKVVDVLLSMPERDRFLRGMVTWVGFEQAAVFYRRGPRQGGQSKYPFWKMIRFAADGVLSFSLTPLRLAILTGFCAIAVAFVGIVWALVERVLTDNWVRGWTSLFVAVLFLGGVQLISLGIIGEYIGRIYGEVKNRPLYIVQERLGFDSGVAETKAIRGRFGVTVISA